MSQVSRPVQIALLATLLFAAVWFLALRPKPADGGGSAPAPAPAAQEAASTPAAEEDAPPPAREEAAPPAAADGGADRQAAAATPRRGARQPRRGRIPAQVPAPVRMALRQRKALALAFVDPRTADARAVDAELKRVSRFGGRAVALAVPIAELSRYEPITREVQVTVAPTVVVVAPDRTATTIVGFADRVEIEQALADALSRR